MPPGPTQVSAEEGGEQKLVDEGFLEDRLKTCHCLLGRWGW